MALRRDHVRTLGRVIALLAVAAALGVVHAQSPPAEQGPATTNAALAATVEASLAQVGSLGSIRVTAESGVVRLDGVASSLEARREAELVARRVDGVVDVVNDLDVATGVREQVGALGRQLERVQLLLPVVGFAAAVFALLAVVAWLVGRWNSPFRRISSNAFMQDLAQSVTQGLIVLAGLVLALQILDATAVAGALVGTAGLAGIALGFAFRDLVENYVSSILLSIRQPFAPNDHVVVDGMEGRVIRLTSRATVLMTLDGNHLRIPNARVFKGVILNYTRNPRRRLDFVVAVANEVDLAGAQEIGEDILRGMTGVLGEPEPSSVIEGLGDSSVPIRFFAWVDQRQVGFATTRSEAIRLVKGAFDRNGIEMPEPIYSVHVREREAVQEPSEGRLDVRPDLARGGDPIVEQIEAERRTTAEPDLLDPNAPRE